MIRLNPDACDDLVARVSDDPPLEIAEDLFGPSWRDSVRVSDYRARASRFPAPLNAAAFLRPLVVGRVFFDDRSRAASRTAGWWTPDDADGWRETKLAEIVSSLHPVSLRLVVAARERQADAQRRLQVADPSERARRSATNAEILRASIAQLERMLASGDRVVAGTAAVWRGDAAFRLPETAARATVLGWLRGSIRAGVWDEWPRLRVAPARVLKQYRDDEGTLPTSKFFDALEELIGPSRKIGVRFYELPDDVEDLDARVAALFGRATPA